MLFQSRTVRQITFFLAAFVTTATLMTVTAGPIDSVPSIEALA